MERKGPEDKNRPLEPGGLRRERFFSARQQLSSWLYTDLRRSFPKYFPDEGTETKLYRKEVIEIELFWNDMLMRLAQSGMMSYKELKSLDVREFFVTLINYEKQLEEKHG